MINLGSKTLPTTSGPFGPFRVFIRKSANGPLLAMTNAFGSIYVKADEATASFTTIKFNPDAAITVGTSAPIQFRFNLTTDVWPHDLFVIESTATAAANMWTLGSPTCKSNTINSPNNYYVAPNSDPNLAPTELGLGCIKIGNKVFINGITREIDLEAVTNGTTSVNSLASEFEVTGFTAPSFVTTSS